MFLLLQKVKKYEGLGEIKLLHCEAAIIITN